MPYCTAVGRAAAGRPGPSTKAALGFKAQQLDPSEVRSVDQKVSKAPSQDCQRTVKLEYHHFAPSNERMGLGNDHEPTSEQEKQLNVMRLVTEVYSDTMNCSSQKVFT